MLKETKGQYQLEETRLPVIRVFEGLSQMMVYIVVYKSDRIATYPYLQAVFANLQEMRIEIPTSTVTPNIIAESITVTAILSITNP